MDWYLGQASGEIEEGEEVGGLGGEEDSEGWIRVKEESEGDGEGVMEDGIGGDEDGAELGRVVGEEEAGEGLDLGRALARHRHGFWRENGKKLENGM